MFKKKNIFLVVSLLYILYTVFPIIPDVTGIEVWLVNLSTFVILLALYPRAFANPVMYWFLAYATILATYILFGKPLTVGIGLVQDSKKVIIECAFILPSISIYSILFYLRDNKIFKIISVSSILFLITSFVYLVPFILGKNTILRDAHHLQLYEHINTLGMPDYTLMHAYIIAIPALLYGIKVLNGMQKWVLITILSLFVFVILHTYVTTSLIITFGTIVFALLYDTKNKPRSLLIIFLAAFMLYFLHTLGAFVQLFNFLIRFFEGTSVEPKIESFKYIYMYGDVENAGGHITGRLNYHNMSWKAFAENFLTGGTSPVGGHSQLIDRLGGMGIICFIPFVMIFVTIIKRSLRIIKDKEQRVFYFLGLFSVFMLLYQKGLFGQEGWLFLMVLLPGLLVTFKNISIGNHLIQENKW